MIIGILISSVQYLNVGVLLAAPSSIYYVANDGDDSNDGLTPSTPWKTIGKVNSEMMGGGDINEGDDVYFNRGDTFSDTYLLMNIGGTSSEQMIVGAYGTGNDPILSGNIYGIYWNEANGQNVRFDNLEISTISNQGVSFRKDNTRNITFSNLTIHGVTNNGMLLYNIDGYTIDNCTVYDCGLGGIVMYGSATYRITNGIIKHSVVYDISTDGFSIHPTGDNSIGPSGWYHTFINCTGYDCGENAFDITSGNHILIKDCEGYSCTEPTMLLDHGPRNVTIDNYYSHTQTGNNIVLHLCADTIIRNSIVEDFTNADLYIYGTLGDPSEGNMTNLTAYNNDFITSYDESFVEIFDEAYDIIFKNNIFYSTLNDNPDTFIWHTSGVSLVSTRGNWSYNMYWRGDNGAEDDTWWVEGGTSHDLTTWNANDEVSNDVRDDPEFADAAGSDFTLNASSPCIDAGSWLTTTNGGGTGTTITVDEASYFFAGLTDIGANDEDIDGDNIFIGSNTDLEVTAVDFAGETITVNRSITWSDGDDVSLSSYYGSAPDIGAYEFPSSGPNDNPPEISNIVRSESNPLDTEPSFGWINITATVTGYSAIDTAMIDISCSNSSSVNTSMNAIGTNGYYYNTSTLFSNHGSYSYYIWANDTNGNASISSSFDFSMPPNWDIDMNGVCNVLDFVLIANHLDETGSLGWIREDVDNNGIINMIDFTLVSEHYFETW